MGGFRGAAEGGQRAGPAALRALGGTGTNQERWWVRVHGNFGAGVAGKKSSRPEAPPKPNFECAAPRWRALLLRSEGGVDVLGEAGVARFDLRVVPLEDLAVLADEEFVEVPLHVAGNGGGRAGEGRIERVLLRALGVKLV